MNGIHDMGGMQGLGPIRLESNEPVFHAEWEGRVYAMNSALMAMGRWNLDAWRHQIELLPPADYLRFSYYERWFWIQQQLLILHGLITQEELASGKPAPGAAKAVPVLNAAGAARRISRNIPSAQDPEVSPRFGVGQRVRARDINPTGHTRLPRYARGRSGTIVRDHGVYVFPDTNAHFQGPLRQHVYSVKFAAQELWGSDASPLDSVHLDLWDDYLEHD